MALGLIEKGPVDLVIADILMPEMEGNELAFIIGDVKPDLKLIGMTGGVRIDSAETIAELCEGALFESILHKPFRAAELLEKVEEALS